MVATARPAVARRWKRHRRDVQQIPLLDTSVRVEVGAVVDFEELVAAHSPALMRLAYVLAGDAHRAEDLVQTTLLAAHRRWRRLAEARDVEAYLRRMLVNAHMDWHRRRSSTELPTDSAGASLRGSAAADPAAAVADRDELRRLLTTLAPRARTVLVLRYYADLDDHAVAAAMGISPSTVRATAARALATLRASKPSDVEESR